MLRVNTQSKKVKCYLSASVTRLLFVQYTVKSILSAHVMKEALEVVAVCKLRGLCALRSTSKCTVVTEFLMFEYWPKLNHNTDTVSTSASSTELLFTPNVNRLVLKPRELAFQLVLVKVVSPLFLGQ